MTGNGLGCSDSEWGKMACCFESGNEIPISKNGGNISLDEDLLTPQIDPASWRELLSYMYLKC